MSDLLSQEEIDALLKGVDEGDFELKTEACEDKGSVKNYDFSSQERIVRRRIPTLEIINDRFSKYLRISLLKFLHHAPEIFIADIEIQKFSDYIRSLRTPTNLNIIRFSPLRGRALIVIDPGLIFSTVDSFFGGGRQLYKAAEERDFTPTEMRVIQILLDMIFDDLKEAWEPVMALNFEFINSEINPYFANIVSADDIVVVSTVNIMLEGSGGSINIVMPYSMIEPIKALLDVIGDATDESDSQWKLALRHEVLGAEVHMYSPLAEKTLSIREVLQLKTGDVIPIDMAKTVTLKVGGVPVFTGKACTSEGYYAVQIIDKLGTESV